jgi:hypothetical protein
MSDLQGNAGEFTQEDLIWFLEGSHSYKIVYIGLFHGPDKDAKLLKINGRGERI